jgi:hypothetical protein
MTNASDTKPCEGCGYPHRLCSCHWDNCPDETSNARLGVEHGGDRPMVDVCLSEDEDELTRLVAYLMVGELDPVLLAAATDGGRIASGGNVPVEAAELTLSDREKFVEEVEAAASHLQARVVVNQEIWETE